MTNVWRATSRNPRWCFECFTIGGGFNYYSIFFTPKIGGKFPFWQTYFWNGLKPPNAFQIGPISRRFLSGLSSAKSVRPLTVAPSSWSRQASFMAEKVNLDEDVHLYCFFWIQRQGVFPKWRRPELHVSSRWWYKQVDSYWSGEILILEFWWKKSGCVNEGCFFHINLN